MTVSDGRRVPFEPRRVAAGIEELANGRSNDAGRQLSNRKAHRAGRDVDGVHGSEGRCHHHHRGDANGSTVPALLRMRSLPRLDSVRSRAMMHIAAV